MKLFTSKEVKDSISERKNATLKELERANKTLQEQIKRLNQKDVLAILDRSILEYDFKRFKSELERKKGSLTKGLEELEKRRSLALEDMTDKEADLLAKNEALALYENMIELEKDVVSKEKREVEQLKDEAQKRNEESRQARIEIIAIRKKLAERATEVELKEKQVLARIDAFSKSVVDHQRLLDEREQVLSNREGIVTVKLKELSTQRAALKLEHKRLDSRTAALKAAFDEAKRKGITIK